LKSGKSRSAVFRRVLLCPFRSVNIGDCRQWQGWPSLPVSPLPLHSGAKFGAEKTLVAETLVTMWRVSKLDCWALRMLPFLAQ
jgi:hypothetical protein